MARELPEECVSRCAFPMPNITWAPVPIISQERINNIRLNRKKNKKKKKQKKAFINRYYRDINYLDNYIFYIRTFFIYDIIIMIQ